jgi:hypothetical protein
MQKPAGCPQTPQIAAALGETASVPLQGHVDFKRLLRERYFSPGTEVDAEAPVVGHRDRSASHPIAVRCQEDVKTRSISPDQFLCLVFQFDERVIRLVSLGGHRQRLSPKAAR